MSHTVVKVTETPPNDSLVLVIDKDGHITPDQETVREYLKDRSESDIRIMQVNKTDGKMDITFETLQYLSSHDEGAIATTNRQSLIDTSFENVDSPQEYVESGIGIQCEMGQEILRSILNESIPEGASQILDITGSTNMDGMNELERNLMSFRMDHDYTPYTCPEDVPSTPKVVTEIDELAETLSILEGSNIPLSNERKEEPPPLKMIRTKNKFTKKPVGVQLSNKRKIKTYSDVIHKLANKVKSKDERQRSVEDEEVYDEEEEEMEDIDEDYSIDSEEVDEDDANDSDYEFNQGKNKPLKKISRTIRTKIPAEMSTSVKKPIKTVKTIKPLLTKPSVEPKLVPEVLKIEKVPEVISEIKVSPEKKVPPKKEKKTPKPILDDFALFSTPDIIRRVGGKQDNSAPSTPFILESPKLPKPAKIFQGVLNKMPTERSSADSKQKRLSVDGKLVPFEVDTKTLSQRPGVNPDILKKKDRRYSLDIKKAASTIQSSSSAKPGTNIRVKNFDEPLGVTTNDSMELEPMPSAEDIRAIIQNEDTKTFTTSLVIPDPPEQDQSQINLENTGLDLDQSLLDNINSDLIPEDILYQVAQSLVGNAELQNVIDKSIVDGNLVLDQSITSDNALMLHQPTSDQSTVESCTSSPMKGTQIMRSGGRMVVIPPIERPTTRSRNKNKQEVIVTPKSNKTLDDEHVSGGELDSSSDGEKSDDDDPDKLWCICNQPHNNRFMICCDSCEEWYHGKCVNVTKAMGHMMEVKGREWICLYCKDPSLLRPEAAARRIRKASHTSSNDNLSEKKERNIVMSNEPSTAIPGCLVCGKPCRVNSIYCSDPCILKHAKVVEKVVVFERSSGTIYTGSSAPTTTNLDKWLQQHPGFEVVRSANANKPVTTKQVTTHAKLKSVKSTENANSTNSALPERKNVNVNILRQSSKETSLQQQIQPLSQPQQQLLPVTLNKSQVTHYKIISKPITTPPKAKLIQPAPLVKTPAIVTPVKPKPVQNIMKTPSPNPIKEKPVPQKTPKSRQTEESITQPSQPENIRDNVKKTLFEQLTNRLNLADDIKVTKEELTKISSEIESQLYKCFGDTGQKYRNKYRSLIFNIKDTKNQTLWRRICEKSINAYQLVRLSPDDLASQELALWRERENKHQLEMITKSELEQLGRNRTFVFKTHKGEQVLEDNRPSDAVDNTEVVMGLGADDGSSESTANGKKDKERDKKSSKHSRTDRHHDHKQSKERERSSRKDKKRERRSSSRDKSRHKRSKSKDSSRHSDKYRSNSREKDRYRSIHKSSRHKKDIQSATEKLDKKSKEILEQLVDNKIVPPLEDRLWRHVQQEDITTAPIAESDSDHEPSSTVIIPTPPRVGENEEISPIAGSDEKSMDGNKLTCFKMVIKMTLSDSVDDVYMKDDADPTTNSIDDIGQSPPPPRFNSDYVWKGMINMIDVAQISITAHEVSGDCIALGEDLPTCLDVVGRISPETVWEYIGKMKCSNSKVISLLRLNATNVEEKMPYLALYSYLSSRNRLGVVKTTNKAVKDFYILPLASQKPLPQSLLPLNGPGFEEARPSLLLGIIVRDKKKRSLFMPNTVLNKRAKLEVVSNPPVLLDRSYTPPPNSDVQPKSSSTSKTPKEDANDEDEPYTPEDSDPDTAPSTNEDKVTSNLNATDFSKLLTNTVKSASFLDTGLTTQTFEPFSNKFDTIPGLDEGANLPANSQEIQRKMEELDQRIAMQKAEIHNMSQDIASSTTTGIGTNALASIALPQNLQQILDSIKGINPGTEADSSPQTSTNKLPIPSSDLTIPLILPKLSARSQLSSMQSVSSSTIPLNLPKSKSKFPSINSPQHNSNNKSEEKSASVLSSLSEEELIRKAAEMLGETDTTSFKMAESKNSPSQKPTSTSLFSGPSVYPSPPNFVPPLAVPLSSKNPLLELDQPPIPGLD
ncbi:hypothetical protein FQA39_LY11340 [Lamprigera yunnana]|nr:hypothetical protein FQA39_LY11340 [Lamprigera yunnana]